MPCGGPSHLSHPHFLYEWPPSPTFSVIAHDECPLTRVSQSETSSRRRLLWTTRGVHKIPSGSRANPKQSTLTRNGFEKSWQWRFQLVELPPFRQCANFRVGDNPPGTPNCGPHQLWKRALPCSPIERRAGEKANRALPRSFAVIHTAMRPRDRRRLRGAQGAMPRAL
jgi:hypothetical protein